MPLPIISIAQMREWETATWAHGVKESDVIRMAGYATAKMAEKMTQEGDAILILAGKGHNGDDAEQAVQFVKNRSVGYHRIEDPINGEILFLESLKLKPKLIVDGLFGIGLNRNLSPSWIKFINEINQSGIEVLAVDVPSGLNADTGNPMGTAIKASITLCMGTVKWGLISTKASPYVGRIEIAHPIGLVECPFKSAVSWISQEDFKFFPPKRAVLTHKGTYGHLYILAGSMGYHGASVLAARGAQKACPGLITLCTDEQVYHSVASQLQSVMVYTWQSKRPIPPSTTAILVGPGLASPDVPGTLIDQIRQWWDYSPLPMVVDATALDWLPKHSSNSSAIRIITPHPGEASRLLNISTEEIQNNRFIHHSKLSEIYGNAWVILKGYLSIVGNSRRQFINPSGNPWLAQGGSGDILAGFLGGLIAQPNLATNPEKTISYAVWQHGATADFLTRQCNGFPWPIEKLLDFIGSVAPILLPSAENVV